MIRGRSCGAVGVAHTVSTVATEAPPTAPTVPETRLVSLTSTGPDGIVIEVQLTCPAGRPSHAIRARLDAAVRHVAEVLDCGVPIEVATSGSRGE